MGDSFFVKPGSSRKRTRPGSRPMAPATGNSSASGPRRGRKQDDDEDITSDSDMDDEINGSQKSGGDEDLEESESDHETEIDKRRRLAKEYLDSLETELVEGFDAKDSDEDIIGRRLRQDVAEQQGQIFRDFTNAQIQSLRKSRVRDKHLTAVCAASTAAASNSVTAPSAPGNAPKPTTAYIYTGAKDGILTKYSLHIGADSNVKPKYVRSRHVGSAILCIAVNTANRMVVTGTEKGFRVWNADSFEMLREFKSRTRVSSSAFRRHTNELYVGASDSRLRTYDSSQFAFVETLHGHQDEISCLSALNQERCVSVGGRDRTAIFWKIPEESRLTFRGGDTKLTSKINSIIERGFLHDEQLGASTASEPKPEEDAKDEAKTEEIGEGKEGESKEGDKKPPLDIYRISLEGSIDCCAMSDQSSFVTGSDNGNTASWSTSRKKAQYTLPLAHGSDPESKPNQASADLNPDTRIEIPPAQPRSITAVATVPFSNTFFTGSWSGEVKMWTSNDDKRTFSLQKTVDVGSGIVTGLTTVELGQDYVVAATLAREPRSGRWLVRPGHDRVVTFFVSNETNI